MIGKGKKNIQRMVWFLLGLFTEVEGGWRMNDAFNFLFIFWILNRYIELETRDFIITLFYHFCEINILLIFNYYCYWRWLMKMHCIGYPSFRFSNSIKLTVFWINRGATIQFASTVMRNVELFSISIVFEARNPKWRESSAQALSPDLVAGRRIV